MNRANSFRNRVELQSYFGRVNATLYKKLLITLPYVRMVLLN
jgi:iron complex outermembrane receptor protein